MDRLHEDRRTFMVISRRFFFRLRTIPEIYFRGNQTSHFMFNKRFPESFYEKCGKRWQNQTFHGG